MVVGNNLKTDGGAAAGVAAVAESCAEQVRKDGQGRPRSPRVSAGLKGRTGGANTFERRAGRASKSAVVVVWGLMAADVPG